MIIYLIVQKQFPKKNWKTVRKKKTEGFFGQKN